MSYLYENDTKYYRSYNKEICCMNLPGNSEGELSARLFGSLQDYWSPLNCTNLLTSYVEMKHRSDNHF